MLQTLQSCSFNAVFQCFTVAWLCVSLYFTVFQHFHISVEHSVAQWADSSLSAAASKFLAAIAQYPRHPTRCRGNYLQTRRDKVKNGPNYLPARIFLGLGGERWEVFWKLIFVNSAQIDSDSEQKNYKHWLNFLPSLNHSSEFRLMTIHYSSKCIFSNWRQMYLSQLHNLFVWNVECICCESFFEWIQVGVSHRQSITHQNVFV